MYNRSDLILEAVYERDLDLMFVEELYASRLFQKFLYERAFADTPAPAWDESLEASVRHSLPFFEPHVGEEGLPNGTGETDIDVEFRDRSENAYLVLIENKIDQGFQPNQVERYAARAALLEKDGGYDLVRTVLLAPAEYMSRSGADAFHARLTYEDVDAHLLAQSKGDLSDAEKRRLLYRQQVLRQASEKLRRAKGSGPKVAHPGVTAFWNDYYDHVTRCGLDVQMVPPNPEGHWARDAWINYKVATVEGLRCSLVHKIDHERVDLQIPGWAHAEDRLRPELERLLEPGMEVPAVKPRTKSLSVTVRVPALDYAGDFDGQKVAAEKAMRAAEELTRWHRQNGPRLAELTRAVDRETSS